MTAKFSFYLPSTAMGADTQKDVVGKQVEEVDTVGETVGVEESFSASTFEGHGSNLGMARSKCETTGENVGDEKVVANDEEAIEDESQPIAKDVEYEEEYEVEYEVEYEEKNLVEKEEEEGRDNDEAYQSCVVEEFVEEECDEREFDGDVVSNDEEVDEDESHPVNDESATIETASDLKFDGDVIANDEEADEEESHPVPDESATIEIASDLKASPKSVEYKEEDPVEKVEEDARDDDEAYESCVEEERVEEEREEDVKQEEQVSSIVSKGDAAATQLSHIVSESQSETQEATNEGDSPSAPTCSIASTSSNAIQDQSVTMPRDPSAASSRLASMMGERLKAMENIRNLLKSEREQENGMRAEFIQKARVLEDDISSKDESIFELKTKNANHVRQLNRLTTTINELVDRNHANITQMTELDQDVAAKIDTIQAMNKDIQGKQSALDKKTDENVALTQQLEIFKAENNDLKVTIEDLQAKNTDDANEQEVLMSSLQELVEQNTALEAQVEELVDANKTLESELIPTKQKHTQLLGTVDNLTESLNEVIKDHKKEFEELQKENEVAKQQMKEEQDTNAATTHQLEKILEETTAQMEGQLSAQKDTFKKQIADLNKALEETKTSCKKKSKRNDKLQKEIEDISRTAFKSAENAASTIVQLEKDLEEEFQITTQLKRGMEDLKKKAQQDEDDKYTDDLEDLLASLRMVQCWQLSHFQRINKLVSENKEQARSIQLLG